MIFSWFTRDELLVNVNIQLDCQHAIVLQVSKQSV